MKTLGYILLGYGLVLLLAGTRLSQAVHQSVLGLALRHLHLGEFVRAFLVMLNW